MTPYFRLPVARKWCVATLVAAVVLASALIGSDSVRKAFDIPADAAENSLKRLAEQSGREVLFPADAVDGVRTRAVKGEMTPRQALEAMLSGTPLIAVQDARTGALTVRRAPPPETAPKNAPAPRSGGGSDSGPVAVPPRAEEEAIQEMSPFVISADADIGYVGAQSLLGSRFRQELRDIPAQIEIFTPEFMLDFDLTRAEDAFRYSASVENSSEFMVPEDGGGVAWSSQTSGRIRGLQPTSFTVSRELFTSITTGDAYNLDRVELASGAQSLLFSLGEPAGMANLSLKRAHMRNSGEVTMRLDSEGGHRETLDYNRVLRTGLAALRLALVNENRPQFIKPSHDRNQRIYGAFTLRPFRGTTIRLHGERVWENSNRPVTHLPFDWATPFFAARQNGTLASLVTTGFGAVQLSPTMVYGANAAPLSYLHWRLQVSAAGPQRQPLDPAQYGAALDPNSGYARTTFNPDTVRLIPEVAASVGRNFLGDNAENVLDAKLLSVIVDQRITDTLRLELGAHRESWDKRLDQLTNYLWFGYYVDANEYIPNVPWVVSTQAPDFSQNLPVNQFYMRNPNYGKLFVHGTPTFTRTVRDTEEYRGSVAWEPDFKRYRKWLGQHSMLGSIGTRTTSSRTQGNGLRLTNPTVKYQNLNPPLSVNDARRALQTNYYIDARHPIMTMPLGDRLSFQDFFHGFSYTEPTTGEVLNFSGWDLPVCAPPSGSKSKIDSSILAWQARFLSDRINFGYGLRRDRVSSYRLWDQIAGVTWDPTYRAWIWMDQVPWKTTPSTREDKTSRTLGGIVRPLPWLSLSYYEAVTFNLPTGSFTPFGDPNPGVSGESRDFGVRVDFLKGRFFLKANVYDVVQVGRNLGSPLTTDAQRMELSYSVVANTRARALGGPNYDQLVVQEGFAGGMQAYSPGPYPLTGDTLSQGWEITGGARLGRLDMRISASKTDARTGNVAGTWGRWLEARAPFWEKITDENGQTWDRIPYQGTNPESFQIADPVTGVRRVMTMKEFYHNVVLTDLAVARAANGRPVDSQRKYRANLNLAYSFSEGWLRGWRAGGAVIYRSAPIVGFPVKPLAVPGQSYATPILDLEKPYYGRSDLNLDAFIAYGGRNFLGSRRPWRIQVNGSNLLTGSNSFRTGKVNAFGESIFTVIETPRAASATLGFQF